METARLFRAAFQDFWVRAEPDGHNTLTEIPSLLFNRPIPIEAVRRQDDASLGMA
jgi:hypothetical protein